MYNVQCTSALETNNFRPQVIQFAALQQRYSPCYSEKPNLRGEKENPNFALNFFLSHLVIKQLSLSVFKDFHEKSAQTDLSNEMWVLISKGLKHMNTVVLPPPKMVVTPSILSSRECIEPALEDIILG